MTFIYFKSTVRRAMAEAYRTSRYRLPTWCVNMMYCYAIRALNAAANDAQVHGDAYIRNFVHTDSLLPETLTWN